MSKVSMSEALMPATDEPSSVVGSPDDNWSLEMLTTSFEHDAVDYPQRLVLAAERRDAADTHFGGATEGARNVLYRYAGHLSFEHTAHVRDAAMATSSAEILTDEPVKLSFFAFLKPVTTIWSITTSGFSFALTT